MKLTITPTIKIVAIVGTLLTLWVPAAGLFHAYSSMHRAWGQIPAATRETMPVYRAWSEREKDHGDLW